MQSEVRASDFVSKLNQELSLSIQEGPCFPVTLMQVKERDNHHFSFADEASRKPFYVIFKGSLDVSVSNGAICTIDGLDRGVVKEVFISRILPESAEPSAWYQAIFN